MAQYKFAFSYSRWSDWSSCPAKYKFKYIDKVDTGPTPKALLEGRKVHDEAADYLTGKRDDLPKRMEKFSVIAEAMRNAPENQRKVEEQMAFDRGKLPVAWFGPNVYMRFIWDAAIWNAEATEIDIIDFKTGKPYGSYDEQAQIFSIPAFWTMPSLQVMRGHWMYLDTGATIDYEITREQFPAIERTWLGNVALMEADRAFPATPSKKACRFCDFGPAKLNICREGIK